MIDGASSASPTAISFTAAMSCSGLTLFQKEATDADLQRHVHVFVEIEGVSMIILQPSAE